MIPIECEIPTGDNPYISWTRPIRNHKDQNDFEILVKKLESEGIIEESQSK